MIHQQLSSICLCHLQTPLALRTPVLSNAFVIYCISLCISSSSSFQPSLFIHFHLQFDTTSTHNEAMDKLQNIRRRSQTMNKCKKKIQIVLRSLQYFGSASIPKFTKPDPQGLTMCTSQPLGIIFCKFEIQTCLIIKKIRLGENNTYIFLMISL